jgi:hypothetical protein
MTKDSRTLHLIEANRYSLSSMRSVAYCGVTDPISRHAGPFLIRQDPLAPVLAIYPDDEVCAACALLAMAEDRACL